MTQASTSNRGFAAMDPKRQREIASEGGRAAHESGHAHEWTSEEAAAAGRKGGLASHHRRAASPQGSATPRRQAARRQDEDQKKEAEQSGDEARTASHATSTHATRSDRSDEYEALGSRDEDEDEDEDEDRDEEEEPERGASSHGAD